MFIEIWDVVYCLLPSISVDLFLHSLPSALPPARTAKIDNIPVCQPYAVPYMYAPQSK